MSVREVTPSEDVAVLLGNLEQATGTNSYAGIETYDGAQGFTTGRERNAILP